ncbi:MAG: hypothetical protein HY849_06245 [Nitrosomonadales bacterium]|nr:hypothetical protein [Nitrosomonadales bacterium]
MDRSNSLLDAKAVVEIKDEQGNLLSKKTIDLRVKHPVIDLKGLGFYSIQVVASDGAKVLGNATAAILPKIASDSESSFGLWHVHGDLKSGIKAGAHWTRVLRTLNTYVLDARGAVVPKPPVKMVAAPVLPGYSFIDTLAYGLPSFLRNDGEKPVPNLYPPKDWLLFEQLVEQFARDFAYEPEYFSVYNEPEIFWQGSDQELVRFLDTIARAIKKEHPTTKVLGPGLATIKIPHLRKLAKLGLFEHMDGFVTNAYAEVGGPEDEFIGRVRELKLLFSEFGLSPMPIYITEYGWTSASGVAWQKSVDELTQARYVARSLALLRAEEVNAAIYFCLRFNGTTPGALGFSVTHSDGTPKPAFVAFATASRIIGPARGKPSLIESDDGLRLLQLRADAKEKSALVIWSRDSDHNVFIPGNFSKSAVDMMGRSHDVSETIKVDESPYYFIAKALLDDIPILKNKQVVKRGASVGIPVPQNIFVPQPLSIVDKKQILIPVNAPVGTYWLVSDANKRITIFPIVVTD